MSFAIFNQKKDNSGGALIAKLTFDNSTLVTLFKQINNDEKNRKNNFDWKNSINIKLSDDEVGDFIRAVRTNGKSKFYHTFDGNTTTGSFGYYCVKAKEEGKPDITGFGMSVTKGDVTIKVGFSNGAAERFLEFLRFNLNKSFEASFIDDVIKDKEFRDKNKTKTATNAKQVETNEAPLPQTQDVDF